MHVGCYGHPLLKTPNIDALAQQSVRFDRAYCQAPLCNPSRSSFLTGLRPPRTRVLSNNDYYRDALPHAVTLPRHFRNNGYVTARAGKIFHGGFDDEEAWDYGGQPFRGPRTRTPEERAARIKRADRWMALDGDGTGQPDYRTADRSIKLLVGIKDKPFFLAVGFVKPHVPFLAPKQYFDLYDPATIPLPGDFAAAPSGDRPAYRDNFDIFINREASEEEARQMIVGYWAATSFMDAQLGRLMKALDRHGLRENTIIVFFSDHGFHLGEKGMWSKQTLFEPSTRVPMMISVPWLGNAGSASGRTVELVDIYPTLVELCGLPVIRDQDGESLAPLLVEPKARWRNAAFTYLRRGDVLGVSVRSERFRYTEWDEGRAGAELYDYLNDPGENNNLVNDSTQARILQRMKSLLKNQG